MIDVPLTSHDVVLGAIALSLLLGTVVGFLSSVSATLGLVSGGVPASGLLGYALFIDPPTGSR